MVDAGKYKYDKNLFDMTFEKKNVLLAVHFLKRNISKDIFQYFINLKKIFAGHIKELGGAHVARGPDVAQALFR